MNSSLDQHLTDKDLIDKILSGNRHAFISMIKNTERLVAQIVFKMVANAEDRKDLAQDIYLKTYKNLPGFRYQAKLSTWIGQIAYNSCLSYLEKKKLVFPGSGYGENQINEEALESLSTRLRDVSDYKSEALITEKQHKAILKAEMEKLSPVFRTLITLFHNEDLSYADIARITELPEGTVKSYLFRARKTLRENLLRNYKKEEL